MATASAFSAATQGRPFSEAPRTFAPPFTSRSQRKFGKEPHNFPETSRLLPTRRQDVANEYQWIAENLGFSAIHPQGKADRMSALSVKQASQSPTATRRQDVANEHQWIDENLGFSSIHPKERPTGCRRFPCNRNTPAWASKAECSPRPLGHPSGFKGAGLTDQPPAGRPADHVRAGRGRPAQLPVIPGACQCPSAHRTRSTW